MLLGSGIWFIADPVPGTVLMSACVGWGLACMMDNKPSRVN